MQHYITQLEMRITTLEQQLAYACQSRSFTNALTRNGLDLVLDSIQADYWLTFFDVDGLKQINETFGKAYAGQIISACICVRETDSLLTLGQWFSGDEFVGIFATEHEAIGYAQRTQTRMHRLRFSATFAVLPVNYRPSIQASIMFADDLVSQLKKRFNRRNCIVLVDR